MAKRLNLREFSVALAFRQDSQRCCRHPGRGSGYGQLYTAGKTQEKGKGMRVLAIVLWFDADRKFGFALPVDGRGKRGIFLHAGELPADGPRELRTGEKISFQVAQGPKGPYAVGIERVA